ncbi:MULTISPECIES: hypothetical protein [unclassified Synechococcus]|uniref:hypothetical protein n=1 Tax=unclassified Synechococcus TaxID=2626047 RepID=UPI0039B10952
MPGISAINVRAASADVAADITAAVAATVAEEVEISAPCTGGCPPGGSGIVPRD